MKNLRKVLAFTLALAMLLGTMTTTFAANEKVQALETLKLVDVQTKEGLANDLTRAVGLATVLKAKGYTQDDANAKAADVKFTDVTKEWQKGWTVLGQEAGVIEGTGEGKFNPEGKLSKKDFTRMMLRTLGYSVEETRGDLADLVAKTALVESLEDDKFTKEEALEVMFDALKVKVKEGDMTLAQKLVKDGRFTREQGQEVGVCQAQPDKLMVESVVADNLKEVVVTFNGTVDKDTAEKPANYKVKNAIVKSVELKEDGMTAVLTLNGTLVNKKDYEVTVMGVKNSAGTAMEKQVVPFKAEDLEYPVVTEVKFVGPKNLKVTFSEPVKLDKTKAKIVLKDGNRQTTAKFTEEEGRTLSVETTSTLKDATEYLVCFGDPKGVAESYAKDYAGYPVKYVELAYAYNQDKTAPEVKVVKADQKVVVVEFNKPVKNLTKDHFYHTYSAYKPYAIYESEEKLNKGQAMTGSETVSKVFALFHKDGTKHALPAGDVTVVVLGEANNKKVQDNWGNVLAKTELAVTISADREAPEVVSAEVTGEKQVKVTFSEEIGNIGERARYTLLLDGKEVEKGTDLSVTDENGKKVAVLGLSKSYAGKTLNLVIKGIKDASLYENMMADYTTTLDFVDKTWEGVENVELKRVGDSEPFEYYLYVTFKEKMDSSALNTANYKFFDGTNHATVKGTADFFEGQANVVVFTLTYDKDKNDKSTDASFLANNGSGVVGSQFLLVNDQVKDLNNNKTPNFQVQYPISTFNPSTGQPVIKSVEAVNTKKVVVKFDKELVKVDNSKFSLKKSGSPFDPDASYTVVDAKTLEIDLTKDMETTAADMALTFDATDDTVDVFGRQLKTVVNMAVEDKLAPAVATKKVSNEDKAEVYVTEIKNLNSPKAYAKVTIKYTEKIKNSSLSILTYTLNNGWGVSSVASVTSSAPDTNTDTVTLEIGKDGGKYEELKALAVTQALAILDEKNNKKDADSNALPAMMKDEITLVVFDTFFVEDTATNSVKGKLTVKLLGDQEFNEISNIAANNIFTQAKILDSNVQDVLTVTRVDDKTLTVEFKAVPANNTHDTHDKAPVTLTLKDDILKVPASVSPKTVNFVFDFK